MNSHFTHTFFTANRRKLREMLDGKQPIVISAHGTLQRTADTSYPFQQESNFWYLTGVNEPDAVLVITENDDYLILPSISHTKAIFDGAPDAQAIKARSGVRTVFDRKSGLERLHTDISQSRSMYTLMPRRSRDAHSGIYANPAGARLLQALRRKHGAIETHDIRRQLARLRMIKQPEEIETIKRAVSITCETLDELRNFQTLGTFRSEYSLEAAITHGFRSRGAQGHAYDPIIASGAHATTLHYVTNSGALHATDLVVVDVGAEVEHYAADITRTLIQGEPSPRQRAVIDEVRGVQAAATELLKPGVFMRDYEKAVEMHMGKALQRLKLISNPNDSTEIRKYYPHATSHFIGLDVHDAGDYTTPLEENITLTCEPGIYIPEEGIGVRLEDDILITKSGNQNLSEHCSYEAYTL